MNKERFAAILTVAMTDVYEFPEAAKTGAVLSGALMNDFKQKLKNTDVGKSVSETYKTEDEKVTVTVEGSALKEPYGMRYVISKVAVNGKTASEEVLYI